MDKELEDLKKELRAIVVSSPAQVDVRSLQRDYRSMRGSAIPINKYGYRDILLFLKERCADCFLFHGIPSNPVLTLIVPDTLKHIDQFVQRQKSSTITKMKGKRRSVEEHVVKPRGRPTYEGNTNMICESFNRKQSSSYISTNSRPCLPGSSAPFNNNIKPLNNNREPLKYNREPPNRNNVPSYEYNKPKEASHSIKPSSSYKAESEYSHNEEKENGYESDDKYMYTKKRLPYDSSLYLDGEESSKPEQALAKDDNDSGRQTSSSRSSTKREYLNELKTEIHELIKENPNGVLCTDLMRLYRERYGRELNFNRVGHNNITSLLGAMQDSVACSGDAGGVRIRDASVAPSRSLALQPRPLPLARSLSRATELVDPEDALPGIEFDADVFPSDCMHYLESIPAVGVQDLSAGAMVPVCVGEVYSPSHVWLQRLGEQYCDAMHRLMDDMSVYYHKGAGRSRTLARGAVCVGHYCASLYEGDWHRAIIVKLQDTETVKVRHVDYGTVDTVSVSSLKPLLRGYAALPAQALRARLAGLRPSAGGRRWPHAAAQHLLTLVRDCSFVANVVAVDTEEECIETFLIDTRGEDDVCVSAEMIRAGHADVRADSALRTGEWHLHPAWCHLESGRAPNYADIHRYLAHDIALDFVPDYRATMPPAVFQPEFRPAHRSPSPTRDLLNRVPLLQIYSPSPAPTSELETTPAPPPVVEIPVEPAPVAQTPPPHVPVEPVVAYAQRQAPVVCNNQWQEPVVSNSERQEPVVSNSQRQEPVGVNAQRQEPVVGNAQWQEPAVSNAQWQAPVVGNSQWQEPAVRNAQSQPPPPQPCPPVAQWGGTVHGPPVWHQVTGPAISRDEWALYNILMLADPAAAHCYLMVTLRRAGAHPLLPPARPTPRVPHLNPLAPPFPTPPGF